MSQASNGAPPLPVPRPVPRPSPPPARSTGQGAAGAGRPRSCANGSAGGAWAAGDPPPALLDAREWQVVLALCEGLPRDAVADRIGYSRSTVNRILTEIYASTGFDQAYQVVAWAYRCRVASFSRRA